MGLENEITKLSKDKECYNEFAQLKGLGEIFCQQFPILGQISSAMKTRYSIRENNFCENLISFLDLLFNHLPHNEYTAYVQHLNKKDMTKEATRLILCLDEIHDSLLVQIMVPIWLDAVNDRLEDPELLFELYEINKRMIIKDINVLLLINEQKDDNHHDLLKKYSPSINRLEGLGLISPFEAIEDGVMWPGTYKITVFGTKYIEYITRVEKLLGDFKR